MWMAWYAFKWQSKRLVNWLWQALCSLLYYQLPYEKLFKSFSKKEYENSQTTCSTESKQFNQQTTIVAKPSYSTATMKMITLIHRRSKGSFLFCTTISEYVYKRQGWWNTATNKQTLMQLCSGYLHNFV